MKKKHETQYFFIPVTGFAKSVVGERFVVSEKEIIFKKDLTLLIGISQSTTITGNPGMSSYVNIFCLYIFNSGLIIFLSHFWFISRHREITNKQVTSGASNSSKTFLKLSWTHALFSYVFLTKARHFCRLFFPNKK